MTSISIPRWASRALLVIVAVAALLLIFRLGSQASAGVALNDPVVWIEDGQNGRLLQINGSTREITAQVEVGEDNDSIVAYPRGRDAVFLNRTTGVVGVVGAVSLSIDDQDDQVGESGAVGDQLAFLANYADDEWENAYIIDTDRAIVVDADGSQRLDIPIPQGQALSDTLVNAEGQLLAITGDSSQVGISTDRGLEQLLPLAPIIDPTAPPPGLVRAGESVYVVDISRRVVNEILDGGELGPDATVCGSPDEVKIAGNVLSQSDGVHRVVVHDGPAGTLSVTEPAAGTCVVIELEESGSNFGEPVVVDATAYLPNYDTGEIVVVDLDDRVVVDTFRFRPATGRAFELEVFDGAVWANEPDGFRAAVVSRSSLEPISKLGDFVVGGELVGDGDGPTTFTGGEGDDGTRVFNADGAVFGVEAEDGQSANGPGLVGGVAPGDGAAELVDGDADQVVAGDGDDAVDDGSEPLEVSDEPAADAPIVQPDVSDPATAGEDLIAADDLPADLPNADVVVPVDGNDTGPDVETDELIANFTFSSDTISVGEEVRLIDDSTGEPTDWNWDFGDGTSASGPDVRKIWDTEGNYTVTLFIAKGESQAQQSHTFQVIAENVLRIPSAGFTLSSSIVEVGESVTFTDTSTGEPDALLWEFGDGNTATGTEVTHNFSEPGVYSVTLTASNAAGPNSVTAEVEVIAGVEAPVANIAQFPGVVEAGQIITLTSASTNSPTSFAWDFGDGDDASGEEVRHAWNEPGTYRVRLSVSNSAGASEAFADIVVEPRVNEPIARFNQSAALAVVGEDIGFSDLSLNVPTSLSWDFGDGTTATGTNVTHSWDSPGTYLVTLTATNDAGSDTTSKQVTIEPIPVDPPTARFTMSDTSVPVNQVVNFTDTSTGNPTEWSWNFGDGSAVSTAKNPNHAFAFPGTYTVTLTATNDGGSTSTSKQITVIDPPTAAFTQTIDELDVSFSDTSQNGPTSWAWNFGDGNTSTAQNPDHTYAVPGEYTVTLITSNDAGDSIPFSTTFTVNKAPTASFSSAVSGLTAQFNDLSADGPTSWLWDFGDGNSSTLASPNHTYDSSDTYDVTLTVTNGAGTDSTTEQVTVELAPPEAIFTCTVVGAGVSCNGTASTSAVSYFWEAPGGTIIGGQGTPNLSVTYPETDEYEITLTVENSEGTPDDESDTVSVVVAQPPTVTGVSVLSETNGIVVLRASATENPAGSGWVWNTPGGTITGGANTSSPTIEYTTGGPKTVTVTASNGTGVSAPEDFGFTVTISNPPVIQSVTGSNNGGQISLSAVVTNTPVSYVWSSPSGGTFDDPTSATPTLTVTSNGDYVINLTVTNADGDDDGSTSVNVSSFPDPPVVTIVGQSAESPAGSVTVQASATNGPVTWNWNVPDAATGQSGPNPTFTFAENGVYNGSVTVTNTAGTSAPATFTITISGFPPDAGFGVSTTAGSTVASFNFAGSAQPGASISWTFPAGVTPSTASGSAVSADFVNPGTYPVTVTVTDGSGSDTLTQNVAIPT